MTVTHIPDAVGASNTEQDEPRSMNSTLSDELYLKICEKLIEESDVEIAANAVTPAMKLREDLDMDSMQAVSLTLDLEDLLGVALEGDEIADMQTVGDLCQLIEQKLTEKSA